MGDDAEIVVTDSSWDASKKLAVVGARENLGVLVYDCLPASLRHLSAGRHLRRI